MVLSWPSRRDQRGARGLYGSGFGKTSTPITGARRGSDRRVPCLNHKKFSIWDPIFDRSCTAFIG